MRAMELRTAASPITRAERGAGSCFGSNRSTSRLAPNPQIIINEINQIEFFFERLIVIGNPFFSWI
jgi:hypothetical protein